MRVEWWTNNRCKRTYHANTHATDHLKCTLTHMSVSYDITRVSVSYYIIHATDNLKRILTRIEQDMMTNKGVQVQQCTCKLPMDIFLLLFCGRGLLVWGNVMPMMRTHTWYSITYSSAHVRSFSGCMCGLGGIQSCYCYTLACAALRFRLVLIHSAHTMCSPRARSWALLRKSSSCRWSRHRSISTLRSYATTRSRPPSRVLMVCVVLRCV